MATRKAKLTATATVTAAVEQVDTTYLQTLLGYNARRAALSIIALFLERLAVYGLKPVDFSVMSVIHHNPGVTSRQLCATLAILPPNLVGLIQSLGQMLAAGTHCMTLAQKTSTAMLPPAQSG